MDDSIIQNAFKKVDSNTQLRGVVKGYLFDFKSVDELFNKISNLLNDQITEIKSIFENSNNSKTVEIDEVPVILKVIETFLGSYLIGGLIDKIILKAKQIDSSDEIKFDSNIKELDDNSINKDDNPNINIMNEDSLFFQSVPYIHIKLISTLKNLKYPETVIYINKDRSKF